MYITFTDISITTIVREWFNSVYRDLQVIRKENFNEELCRKLLLYVMDKFPPQIRDLFLVRYDLQEISETYYSQVSMYSTALKILLEELTRIEVEIKWILDNDKTMLESSKNRLGSILRSAKYEIRKSVNEQLQAPNRGRVRATS